MSHMKPGSRLLYDNATDNIVGYRDTDGDDQAFLTMSAAGLQSGGAPLTAGQLEDLQDELGITAQAAAIAAVEGRVPSILRGGRAVAIGDSITAGGNNSWYYRLCNLSGGRLRNAKGSGVGGDTLEMMVSRVQTDLPKSLKPDVFFITGGTNGYSVYTTAQNVANLKALIGYAYTIGAQPVLVKCPGINNGYKPNALAMRAAYSDLAASQGVLCIDPWINLTDSTGGWIVGADAGDGVHPSPASSSAAAEEAWRQISGYIGYGWDGLSAMPSISGGLLTSQQFFPDTNADGVPDGWVVNTFAGVGGVRSVYASDVGNRYKNTTDGVNGSGVPQPAGGKINQLTVTGLTLAAGDRLAIAAKCTITGYPTGIQGYLRLAGTGMTDAYALQPLSHYGNLTDAIVWGETTVPAGGLSALDVHMRILTTGDVIPSVGEFSVQQLQIWNLTQMGIV